MFRTCLAKVLAFCALYTPPGPSRADDGEVFEIVAPGANGGLHLPESLPGEIEAFGPGILHLNSGEIEMEWTVVEGRIRVDWAQIGVDLTGARPAEWPRLLGQLKGPAATVVCRGCTLDRTAVLRLKGALKHPLLLSFPDCSLPAEGIDRLWAGLEDRVLALSLSGCNTGAAHVEALARLKSLRWLDLSRSAIGDAELEALNRLPTLNELRIAETEASDDCLLGLAGLPGMKVLRSDLPHFLPAISKQLKARPGFRFVNSVGDIAGEAATVRPVRNVTDWFVADKWSGRKRVKRARKHRLDVVRKLLSDAGVSYPPRQLLLRAFKREKELEVWASSERSGPLVLVATYEICLMSGKLGPKRQEGDMQVPEGFYHLDYYNKNSQFHLSFRVNYPNASDQILGVKEDLGGAIMFHGSCASIGCLSMGDERIEELWVLTRSMADRDRRVHSHILPSRDMARLISATEDEKLKAFWSNLKEGDDLFRETQLIPRFEVNGEGRYIFER